MSTVQSLPDWKEEVNAKLNEHRSRRARPSPLQGRLAELEPTFAGGARRSSTSNIAARVAERYAKAPSYREMLEQEARKSPARLITKAPAAEAAPDPAPTKHSEPSLFETEAAEAQIPVEASAEPAAEAPVRSGHWADSTPEAAAPEIPEIEPAAETTPASKVETTLETEPDLTAAGSPARPSTANPELFETAMPSDTAWQDTEAAQQPARQQEHVALPAREPHAGQPSSPSLLDELEAGPVEPAQPLPARIIEFPRELIAPRKPRLRRQHSALPEATQESSQLRIFEAEPQSAQAAQTAPAPALPDWSPIRLDEEPQAKSSGILGDFAMESPEDSLLLDPPIYSASFEDRIMASLVDLSLVGAGFLVFVATFVASTAQPPTGKLALAAAAAAFGGLFVLYQYLFLRYAQGTPGMRYARIALCTFDDENPTREAMRARVGAIVLSALPVGLGFLWSLFDEDRLGWHDRMTRTYQRSYRED